MDTINTLYEASEQRGRTLTVKAKGIPRIIYKAETDVIPRNWHAQELAYVTAKIDICDLLCTDQNLLPFQENLEIA